MGIHKDIGKVEVLGSRITCHGLMQTPVQQVASRASSKWQHEQERCTNRNAAVLSLDRTFTRWRAERCKSDQQHRWGDGRSNTSEQRSGESGVVARWRDGGAVTCVSDSISYSCSRVSRALSKNSYSHSRVFLKNCVLKIVRVLPFDYDA
ncbi:hypothetical protein NL676_013495 [Syzygium grande]|nr:hypothetical protein NL676_013495 [Syzygium grande]